MANKTIKAMKLPQLLAELRAFLDQFRERVPGFALLVVNLAALTSGPRNKGSNILKTRSSEANNPLNVPPGPMPPLPKTTPRSLFCG